METECIDLLFSKQRKIINLDIPTLHGASYRDPGCLNNLFTRKPYLTKALQNVTSLGFNSNCSYCLQAFGDILHNCGEVNALIMKNSCPEAPFQSRIDDQNNVTDEWFDQTFSKVLALPKPRIFSPVALTLHNLDLKHCSMTYLKALDCKGLKSLIITHCIRTDIFLDEISRANPSNVLRIKTFQLFHIEPASETFINTSLTTFFGAFGGLENLHLSISSATDLKILDGSLQNHHDTLKSLYLGLREVCNRGQKFRVQPAPSLDTFCSSAPKLQQLALPLDVPSARIPNTWSDSFVDSIVSLVEDRRYNTTVSLT